jgi:PAS domain S-box-containing protein
MTMTSNPIIRVLLVEDDDRFARLLRQSLSASTASRIELVPCRQLEQSLARLTAEQIDAVLLDLHLPGCDGLDAFARIQAHACNLPVIILADFDNETLALQAVREGAQDYLVKSKFEGRFLSRVIRYAIERKETERRLATQCAVTRALAESTTLSEAASGLLEAAGERLGWEIGALWTMSAGFLRAQAVWRRTSSAAHELETALRRDPLVPGSGFFGGTWASGEPDWCVDLATTIEPHRVLAARARLTTALGVPVAVQRRVLGVIGLLAHGPRPVDRMMLQMMNTAGDQLGQFMLRKQAEASLAEERNLLRTLVDTLPDAIYVKDTASRFVLANLGVARLMGAAKVEDLYGKTDFDFYPPELARQYYADERAVIASGQALINREEPLLDATGRRGWLLTTKAPLHDLRGHIAGLVGLGRDITERRQAEEAHRLTEARLQAILDNTTAVIYVKDPDGRYLLANRQFETLFRVPHEQVVQRTDAELFAPEIAARFRANDQAVLAARVPLEFEEIAPHPDGPHTYLSIKFPLWDGEGRPCAVCGISSDITERKRVETQLTQANAELVQANAELSRSHEALRQALAELQTSHEQLKAAQLRLIQAEKLESIGTLAAGVAHEVKNPLQTILMGVTYLHRRVNGADADARLVLDEIHDAIRRADSIVRGLVEYSALNHPDVQPESLNAIVEASLALVKYQLTEGHITLVKELSPTLPTLPLERNKIEQAFINLFLNAVQAMPGGGTLHVRTFAQPATPQPDAGGAAGTASRSAPEVVAEVEDSGGGIPVETLNRVFDPFFTTKPTGLGTGLGLSVTRKIIELHGGSITVANRERGGARFTITFKPLPNCTYEQSTHSGG